MTRSEYRNKLETSLQKMESRIVDLEAKIDEADGPKQGMLRRFLDEVRAKRDAVRRNLQRAGTVTDVAWSELKRGLDAAWQELEVSYDRARSRLADSGLSHG